VGPGRGPATRRRWRSREVPGAAAPGRSPAAISGPGNRARRRPWPPAPRVCHSRSCRQDQPPSATVPATPPPPDPVYAGKKRFSSRSTSWSCFRLTQHWNRRTPGSARAGPGGGDGLDPPSPRLRRTGERRDGGRLSSLPDVPAHHARGARRPVEENARHPRRHPGDRRPAPCSWRKVGLLPGYTHDPGRRSRCFPMST